LFYTILVLIGNSYPNQDLNLLTKELDFVIKKISRVFEN